MGILGAVSLGAACSGDKHAAPIADGATQPRSGSHSGGKSTTPVPTKMQGGAGGTDGADGADGGSGGTGPVAGKGIVVTISAPSASSDPNKDDVIVTDKVTVTCSLVASGSSAKVDPSTVTLEVLDADGNPAKGIDQKALSAPGVPTGMANEYSTSFTLGSVATGVVSFRCSGKALQDAATGTATISTFVDHGPTVTAKLPEEGSAHRLKGVLPVEFTVTPAPVAAGDKGATVDGVKLQVAGVAIDDITEDPKNPGTWSASVDFEDALLFPQQPPEHTSVHIEASNVRAPKPVTAIKDYPIVVDGMGPAIAYVGPRDNAAVHGETVITFTASDSGAGLDVDTLALSISGIKDPIKFDPTQKSVWGRNGDTFTFRFDPAGLLNVDSQIIVSIRADDLAQNLTDGVTLLLYRDDQPPAIDLDPGEARVYDSQKACSAAFDPLFGALNDGDKTNVNFNLLRALVYDQANKGSGQTTLYFAGTDQGSVRMYAQPHPDQPFLIDTNADGTCDSLAREDFTYVSLRPVNGAGQLQYSKTDFATPPAIDPGGATCALRDPVQPPLTLCSNQKSDMSVVVEHDIETAAHEPIIYANGGLAEPECTGSPWDFSLIPGADDWVCFAVRATDKLGNQGISRPLRICYDSPSVPGVPACATGEPPPSCTTSCTPPPGFGPHIYHY